MHRKGVWCLCNFQKDANETRRKVVDNWVDHRLKKQCINTGREREREQKKRSMPQQLLLGKMASTFVFHDFQLKHENLITS